MHLNLNNFAHTIKTASLFAGLMIFIPFYGCSDSSSSNEKGKNIPADRETLVKINKNLVRSEEQRIDDFVKRYHWNMNETGSGLRYMIYKKETGKKVKKDNIVSINYKASLLSGEELYSSDEKGSKTIHLGKGEVEKGLEEGILMLNEGDRAKFIIPSHLAYGLVGDGAKIPAKATLVYDVELLEIK